MSRKTLCVLVLLALVVGACSSSELPKDGARSNAAGGPAALPWNDPNWGQRVQDFEEAGKHVAFAVREPKTLGTSDELFVSPPSEKSILTDRGVIAIYNNDSYGKLYVMMTLAKFSADEQWRAYVRDAVQENKTYREAPMETGQEQEEISVAESAPLRGKTDTALLYLSPRDGGCLIMWREGMVEWRIQGLEAGLGRDRCISLAEAV